jgi:hypothetical protein
MSGKYYPNNFDAIAGAPDELFEPCSYDEFVDWRLCMWQIPSSISCIIRAECMETGKITEHVYRKPHAAKQRLIKYMQDGNYRVTVADHDYISLVGTHAETDSPDSGTD